MAEKRLKDPIYGYIEIEESYMRDVVDTATFQRLRNIVQTSYAPLYSAAVHNRFIHSMGVYHLGRIALDSLLQSVNNNPDIKKTFITKYGKLFLLACLLHDVGHAPFSHTGENYFLDLQEKGNKQYSRLHKQLIDVVRHTQFAKDIKNIEFQFEPAKPHEIMSALVALKEFPDLFSRNTDRAFFARCITGYCYSEPDADEQILNCFIKLLNSNVIDVDKLDYLIRDAYITGFDTVKIDYVRLLRALCLQKNKNGQWEMVFHKSALSVIQNVVFAHDAEKHWIQNHPVVLYEGYILKHAIAKVNEMFSTAEHRLFSYESLTESGNQLSDHIHISLLTDDDLVFLMKNICSDDVTKEYFSRKDRRHPAWKSEAEYRHLFYQKIGEDSILTNCIEKEIDQLSQYIINITGNDIINESAIEACEQEIQRLRNEQRKKTTKKKQNLAELQTQAENHLKWLNCMKKVADTSDVDFDFLIIKADQFNSGFMKQEFSGLPITFSDETQTDKFGDIVTTNNAAKTEKSKFFYLFYRRKQANKHEIKTLDVAELVTQFISLANGSKI